MEEIEITFLTWLGIQNPDLLRQDIYAKAILGDNLEQLRRMSPWDFFNEYNNALKLGHGRIV